MIDNTDTVHDNQNETRIDLGLVIQNFLTATDELAKAIENAMSGAASLEYDNNGDTTI